MDIACVSRGAKLVQMYFIRIFCLCQSLNKCKVDWNNM
ncbi:hypothetical protein AM1_2435 [Acaryochloris marina MBIC11017]|uniref:Uncharacterized protein n=1 Tax=Acaryochloris marina (strain MBIC 11017) TaxID=329726 RepID=B0C452_ACAM1|nr:hypothetical protein AM1_2435 [Acaryochloris marina MBIC11017]